MKWQSVQKKCKTLCAHYSAKEEKAGFTGCQQGIRCARYLLFIQTEDRFQHRRKRK